MNVWKVSYHTPQDGMQLAWFGSYREAKKRSREFREQCGLALGPDVIERVVIHTNKAGLLAWLNFNFNTDNE